MEFLYMGLENDKNKSIAESMRKMDIMNNMVAVEFKTPMENLE
jgi:hypothetical protein